MEDGWTAEERSDGWGVRGVRGGVSGGQQSRAVFSREKTGGEKITWTRKGLRLRLRLRFA